MAPLEPSLVGQEPTISSGTNFPENEAAPAPAHQEEVSDKNSEDQSGLDSHYEELHKLSLDAGSGGDDSMSISEPGPGTPSESTPSQLTQQQAAQQLEAERHLLQLREETLKLQQQVQAQERKQFLEQVELDRRQRELEYEKRNIENIRERREERESRKEDHDQQWRKREAKRSDVEPKPEMIAPKPKVIVPPRSPRTPTSGRDLMDESLEHPLLAP